MAVGISFFLELCAASNDCYVVFLWRAILNNYFMSTLAGLGLAAALERATVETDGGVFHSFEKF